MICLMKKTLKFGLWSALALGAIGGASYAIAGPGRTKAMVHQMHQGMLEHIDSAIDDPAALRSQLMEMEAEYPKRITQVRRDLAELREEVRQLEKEEAVSNRVVELTDADLHELEVKLAQFATQPDGTRLASYGRQDAQQMKRIAAKANQVRSTRIAYANRANDAAHSLKYLHQQEDRLEDLLAQLETERSQFKTQILALSRQVDAIARNERLIGLLERRNKTIDRCSRYEAGSLDQLNGRLSAIRSRQEAELELLAREDEQSGYEDVARLQLDSESLHQRSLQAEEELLELQPFGSELETALVR